MSTRTLKRGAAALAVAGTMALAAGGPPASAAHCTAEGPGHSYFGTDHVQESSHDEGRSHRGFSSCDPQNNNPSERSSGGRSQRG
jgi:hypothetical protein